MAIKGFKNNGYSSFSNADGDEGGFSQPSLPTNQTQLTSQATATTRASDDDAYLNVPSSYIPLSTFAMDSGLLVDAYRDGITIHLYPRFQGVVTLFEALLQIDGQIVDVTFPLGQDFNNSIGGLQYSSSSGQIGSLSFGGLEDSLPITESIISPVRFADNPFQDPLQDAVIQDSLITADDIIVTNNAQGFSFDLTEGAKEILVRENDGQLDFDVIDSTDSSVVYLSEAIRTIDLPFEVNEIQSPQQMVI